MMPTRQWVALKELEYQLELMVGEAEVRMLGLRRSIEGQVGDPLPGWLIESSRRRLQTRLDQHEEDRALHQSNLETIRKEFSDD